MTTASPLTGFVPWTIFLSSCSRGALLESVLKRGRTRRLRVVSRKHTSGRPGVTVRAHYGALPQVGWTGAGERGEIRGMASRCSHLHPEARSSSQKSPRWRARWRRARRRPVSQGMRIATKTTFAPFRRAAAPHHSRGGTSAPPRALRLRERERVAGRDCSLNVLVLFQVVG